MVYLAKKGVVHHTGLEVMKGIDGIDTPEMTVSEAEFEAAGGLARIINWALIFGKTEAEAARYFSLKNPLRWRLLTISTLFDPIKRARAVWTLANSSCGRALPAPMPTGRSVSRLSVATRRGLSKVGMRWTAPFIFTANYPLAEETLPLVSDKEV